MAGVPGADRDARKRPRKLRYASELKPKGLEQIRREHSPRAAQVEPYDPGDKVDASPASSNVEDVGRRPKKLRKASKRVRKCLQPGEEKILPSRPREEPHDPGGDAAVSGSVHDVQEHPRNVRDERIDGTSAPRRDTDRGGHLEVQGSPRGVEVEPDRRKVFEDAGYDGKRPRSQENQRYVETNVLRRVRGPEGHLVEEVGPGDIGEDRERQSDGDGDEMDGRTAWMDDATSGAHHDSKRVGTKTLAEVESSQHERREREIVHVPRPSTPPTIDHRHPTEHPNPPRRRGRIKTRPRQISQTRARKLTHHFERSRRSRIGRPRSDGYTP